MTQRSSVRPRSVCAAVWLVGRPPGPSGNDSSARSRSLPAFYQVAPCIPGGKRSGNSGGCVHLGRWLLPAKLAFGTRAED
jgi:hypothetical protein